MAETASAAKQAEAQRDLELKRADYMAAVRKQQATADKTYDIQTNIMQQQVVAEQVGVERVQREEQIKVQDAEIQRRERELIATVLKPAEVERQKIETLAAAEKQKRSIESQGDAEAARQQGQGDADAEAVGGSRRGRSHPGQGSGRSRRDAPASRRVPRVQPGGCAGQASYPGLPEDCRFHCRPLSQVDKITIVSTGGDGKGAGANQLTAECRTHDSADT